VEIYLLQNITRGGNKKKSKDESPWMRYEAHDKAPPGEIKVKFWGNPHGEITPMRGGGIRQRPYFQETQSSNHRGWKGGQKASSKVERHAISRLSKPTKATFSRCSARKGSGDISF